jgi:hypothetical protein
LLIHANKEGVAMTYITPPECQGQIVTNSYRQIGNILLMRCHDASDRSTAYYRYDLEDDETIDPANGEPQISDWTWTPISEAEAGRLETAWDQR